MGCAGVKKRAILTVSGALVLVSSFAPPLPAQRPQAQDAVALVRSFIDAVKRGDLDTATRLTANYQAAIIRMRRAQPQVMWPKLEGSVLSEQRDNLSKGTTRDYVWPKLMGGLRPSSLDPRLKPYWMLSMPGVQYSVSETRRRAAAPGAFSSESTGFTVYVSLSYPTADSAARAITCIYACLTPSPQDYATIKSAIVQFEVAWRVSNMMMQSYTIPLTVVGAAVINESIEYWLGPSGPYPTSAPARGPVRGGVGTTVSVESRWMPINNGLQDLHISSIAIHPSGSTIYAGTAKGIFRSSDAGQSWRQSSVGLTDLTIGNIVIDPTAPSVMYAGTVNGGLHKSTDGGETWTTINRGLPGLRVTEVAVHPQNSSILVVGVDSFGIYRSSDGGGSWRQVWPGRDVRTFVFDSWEPTNAWAATTNSLLVTHNNGASWSVSGNASRVLPNPFINGLAHGSSWSTEFGNRIRFSIVYAGPAERGLWYGVDGGQSWFSLQWPPIDRATVTVIRVDPRDPKQQALYIGTNGAGVFRSSPWLQMNEGLTDLNVGPWALAFDPHNPDILYVGTAGGGVFKRSLGRRRSQIVEGGGVLTSLAGDWRGKIADPQGGGDVRFSLTGSGPQFRSDVVLTSGKTSKTGRIELSVEGRSISGTISYSGRVLVVPCRFTIAIKGEVTGDQLAGTTKETADCTKASQDGTIQLVRVAKAQTPPNPVPAPKPPSTPAPAPTSPRVQLQIKAPPSVSRTPVRLNGDEEYTMWSGLRAFAASQRIILESSAYDDPCYFGAIDAMAMAAKERVGAIAFGELARKIIEAPLSVSTGVPKLDLVFKAGAYLTNVVGKDELALETVKFLVEESLGYACTKVAGQSAGDLMSGPISLTVDEAQKLLDAGLVVTDGSADNTRSKFFQAGSAPATTISYRLAYNPYSQYVTAGIRAECSTTGRSTSNYYVIRYRADKDGRTVGVPEVCSATTRRCVSAPR